jgi:uncharacterized protein
MQCNLPEDRTMRCLLFSLICSLFLFFPLDAAASPLAGDWDGTLDAGVAQLRLVLHIKANDDGSFIATLDSVDQGANGIPVENVSFENNTLKLEIPAVHGSYVGLLDKEGKTLTGKWTQATTLSLTFKKRSTTEKTAAPSVIDGAWQGLLVAGEQKLRIALQISTGPDGALGVLLVSLDQGPSSMSGKNVKFDGAILSFDVPTVHGRYEGKLAEDKNTIQGTWTQGSALPLDFKRGGKPVAAERPQQPKPPFPYRQEEVHYPGAPASGAILAGTLTRPQGAGPFPAVLLIPGSGPHDRDETIFGHKPFLVLADYLTRHGIAVLRYDDRGVGGSTGDFSSVTSADLANDAAAGVRYLSTRPDVDKERLGLIGHSEGGMLAPMVALQERQLAFVVLLAGPAVSGDRVILEQQERISKANNVPEVNRRELLHALTKVLELVREGRSDTDLETEARKLMPNQPEMAGTFKSLNTPWFRYFASYDPKPALTRLKCPVLALYGEKDLQVLPEQNAPVVKAALQEAGNGDATVQLLPGLNHLFQACKTGSPAEYGKLTETISPVALQTVESWIQQHVSRKQGHVG